MSLLFDLLPDELFVIIVYYLSPRELQENEYLKNRISYKWLLLFTLAFPDIYLKLIEDIDYSSQDFDYLYLIYKNIRFSYWSAKQELKKSSKEYLYNINRLKPEEQTKEILSMIYYESRMNFHFSLDKIHNMKLKFHILNKNQSLKDQYVRQSLYKELDFNVFYDDKYQLNSIDQVQLKLTSQEGLTLLTYIYYADV